MNTFWFDNISILFEKKELTNFFPVKHMSLNEKLNAIVRLCAYLSIVLYFYSTDYKVIYILLSSLLLTFLIHKYSSKEDFTDNVVEDESNMFFKEKKIIEPTKDNPFMNVTFDEYKENPNRESVLKIDDDNKHLTDDEIKMDIEKKFNENLFLDINDIYGKNNSQRQFYTNPITTIPNDQTAFAEWLYKRPHKTCKEGNGDQCAANNHYNLQQLPIHSHF